MTVRELINELENYDDDQEVMIGQFQTYGSDWCYTISEVEEHDVNGLYGDDMDDVVLILEGRQDGTIKSDDDEDDEWDDEE